MAALPATPPTTSRRRSPKGTFDSFRAGGMLVTYANYEKNVAYLASQHCDAISIEGAPPFPSSSMAGSKKIEDRHIHLVAKANALRAMKTKKISGATSFGADLNKSYVKYFEDCGIGVAAMEGMDDVRVRGGIATRRRAFVDQGSAG
jgi:hypothetical protein